MALKVSEFAVSLNLTIVKKKMALFSLMGILLSMSLYLYLNEGHPELQWARVVLENNGDTVSLTISS